MQGNLKKCSLVHPVDEERSSPSLCSAHFCQLVMIPLYFLVLHMCTFEFLCHKCLLLPPLPSIPDTTHYVPWALSGTTPNALALALTLTQQLRSGPHHTHQWPPFTPLHLLGFISSTSAGSHPPGGPTLPPLTLAFFALFKPISRVPSLTS